MNVGDTVRVLAPFDTAFPGTYVIEAFHAENNSYAITGGTEFEAQFLEVV